MSLNVNEIEYIEEAYEKSGNLNEASFYKVVRILSCCENFPLEEDLWINCGYKDKEPILYFLQQETDELGDRIQERWIFCRFCGTEIKFNKICIVRREGGLNPTVHTIITDRNLMKLNWPHILKELKEWTR